MNIIFDTYILTTMPVKRGQALSNTPFNFIWLHFQLSCKLKIFFANIFLGGKGDLLTIIQINPK